MHHEPSSRRVRLLVLLAVSTLVAPLLAVSILLAPLSGGPSPARAADPAQTSPQAAGACTQGRLDELQRVANQARESWAAELSLEAHEAYGAARNESLAYARACAGAIGEERPAELPSQSDPGPLNPGPGDADLELSKSAVGQSMDLTGAISEVSNQVTAGLVVTYTLIVTDTGPASADNVVIEDNLPGELDVVSVSSSSGGCVAGTPGDPSDPTVCAMDTLPSGGTRVMRVVARVRPDAVTDTATDQALIHNDARTSSDVYDPNNGDNLATNATTADAMADLALDKFAVGSFRAGSNSHYEISIRNLGPSVSRDVLLRDFLPSQVEFLDAQIEHPSAGPGSVPLPCGETVGSHSLFCPLGDIAPTGAERLLVFVNVHVKSGVPDSTSITNVADVLLTETPDPNSTNNTDSVTVTAPTSADVSIQKRGEPQKVNAGEQIEYIVTVENKGASDAQNVTITDTLPPEVAYETDTAGCVEGPPGTLACTLGALAAGETREFSVWALVDDATAPGTTITNTAVAAATTTDPDPSNNSASAENLVLNANSDLAITKTGPATAGLGEVITYTLMISNTGPATAPNVEALDFLPAGLKLVGLTPSQGNCMAGVPGDPSRPVMCNLGAISPAGTATVDLLAQIDPMTAIDAVLFNDAQVISDSVDPHLWNNVYTVATKVSGCAVPPATPALLSPLDGAMVSLRKVLLDWSSENCATRYKVQIKEVSTRWSRGRTVTTSVSEWVTGELMPMGYLWRARACNAVGCSPFSAARRFTANRR